MTMKAAKELLDLFEKSKAAIEAMSPQARELMFREQARSWVRGEAELAKDERPMRTRARSPVSPWYMEAMSWRKRARAAEIQRDKLLRRLSRFDRRVQVDRELAKRRIGVIGYQTAKMGTMIETCLDAERALGRWKPGMNAKDTKQVIDDAQAFLGLITNPWELKP